MSIETLMTAADAAGYVMVSEDELPDTFGRKPSLFDFKTLPSTSLAIWRPVTPRETVSRAHCMATPTMRGLDHRPLPHRRDGLTGAEQHLPRFQP